MTIPIFTVPWAPLYYLRDLNHLSQFENNSYSWICIGIQKGIAIGMEQHIGSILKVKQTLLQTMPLQPIASVTLEKSCHLENLSDQYRTHTYTKITHTNTGAGQLISMWCFVITI